MQQKDILITLEQKNISLDSVCVFKRTYNNKLQYCIGKLQKPLGIYMVDVMYISRAFKQDRRIRRLEINYDNYKYLSPATKHQKCLYKLWKYA